MSVAFRPMQPSDRPFIVSGWSSSYRTSDHAGLISMRRWAEVMHRETGAILDHPTTRTLVAEEPGELDHQGRSFLYGFLVWTWIRTPTRWYEPGEFCPEQVPYVHYVYVKAPYRRGRERLGLERGYAGQLLAAADIDPRRPFLYGCRTSVIERLTRKIPLAEFDPLPARYLE